MVIFPLSKINIGLNIIRKRDDGYHDLQTIFVPVGWTDVLEVVPSSGEKTTLRVTGNPCQCPMEKNLVIKALKAVEKFCGDLPPVDIFLRKIVPDGAGLGGGSADAAAMVEALDSLFGLGLDKRKMAEICSTVGADCPFFIYRRPELAEGTGTTMRSIDLPGLKGLNIVIAKPPVSVSTARAYAGVVPSGKELDFESLATLPVKDWRHCFYNDFEDSVFPEYPEIKALKDYFYEHGALYSSMSGSGSAVFALYEGDILADTESDMLRDMAVWTGSIK